MRHVANMTFQRRQIPFVLAIGIMASTACCDEPPSESDANTSIDQRSYQLGGIAVFAEMVNAGVKTLALSAPLEPAAMDALIQDASRIIAEHDAQFYRETDFLVTDLFTAGLTDGKHVLLIYSGDTRQKYLELKATKQRLVESDSYSGPARSDIARQFGKLLSYSEEKVDELLGVNPDDETN
jgi:hypothetical protein